MRRIGIDVGGTNTDAVLLEDDAVAAGVKTPTTADVTTGITRALAELAAPGGKVTASPPSLQLWVGLEAGAALLAPPDDASAAPAVATDSRAPPLS